MNKTTTSEEVGEKFGTHAKGKYVIVTGGSGGLGFETARVLCKHGAHVQITCRTTAQGEEMITKIKKDDPEASISYGTMDLTDLDSVKAFSKQYIESGKPLNILINNAGVMACDKTKTKNGFEMQLGVNHIGHFVLTKLLLPLLSSSGTTDSKSRVINISSVGNWLYGEILWDDFNGDKAYNKWQRYFDFYFFLKSSYCVAGIQI